MFQNITLHGGPAAILYGYREAAVLRTWRIVKHEGQWRLIATIATGNPYELKQKGLLFTAPHAGIKGRWCWPVAGEVVIQARQLTARLGPPEQ